jgi:hypothetical protein
MLPVHRIGHALQEVGGNMVKLALHSIAYEAKTLNLAKEGYTAFYVDGTNGLDIHDGGSWGQAFKTIQHAVDESKSWTTIFIKAGTYDENVVIANDGMLLEGQSRDTVKIAPTSGTALTITGENFKADSITTVSNIFDVYSTILQGRYGRLYNVAFTSTIAGGRGAHIDASNCDLQSIYINDALTRLGVIFAAGINGSEIRDSYLKLTDSVAYAIGFSVGATNVLIHDNTIEGCWYGVGTASGVGNNTIFHNNFISVTVPIHGLNDHYFENHYSSHTTDTNNDGFCDTPFIGTVTDYKPVSKRNGWKQESLGIPIVGGGDATQAKQDIIIANQAGEETISSYNLPNDVAENTTIEITNTKRLCLDSVWIDFVNLVQDVTIKVYHKIDGSTYRQYDEFSWATTEEDGVLIRDITINGDWKLTVTSTVAQGAIKAIPYNVIKTTMEV